MKRIAYSIPLLASLLLTGCSPSVPFASRPTAALQCTYDGKTHQAGESFPATDTCNNCSCGTDGKVTCSQMNCDAANNPARCKTDDDCKKLDLDSSFCTTGNWQCQQNQCVFQCDIGGKLAQ